MLCYFVRCAAAIDPIISRAESPLLGDAHKYPPVRKFVKAEVQPSGTRWRGVAAVTGQADIEVTRVGIRFLMMLDRIAIDFDQFHDSLTPLTVTAA